MGGAGSRATSEIEKSGSQALEVETFSPEGRISVRLSSSRSGLMDKQSCYGT